MKLVRFEQDRKPRIGVVVEDMVVDIASALGAAIAGAGTNSETATREAEARIPTSMSAFLAGYYGDGEPMQMAVEEALSFAAASPAADFGGKPIVRPLTETTLLAPVGDPQKIICVGQNYRDHCIEQNKPFPEKAILFAKYPTTINDPGKPVVLTPLSQQVDYEAELAFVIGRRGKNIPEASAKEYIAGYMCLNDVTARDIQMGDGQWVRGKTFDTFAPIGPYLVTGEEIADPQNLDISLTLNGQVMQSSNTSNLIFGIDFLVSYISQVVTLLPGDIVTTGTPGGVGMYRDPQVFLKPGDTMSVTIAGLGTLTSTVTAPE